MDRPLTVEQCEAELKKAFRVRDYQLADKWEYLLKSLIDFECRADQRFRRVLKLNWERVKTNSKTK